MQRGKEELSLCGEMYVCSSGLKFKVVGNGRHPAEKGVLEGLGFAGIAGVLLEADAVGVLPSVQVVDREVPIAVEFLCFLPLQGGADIEAVIRRHAVAVPFRVEEGDLPVDLIFA